MSEEAKSIEEALGYEESAGSVSVPSLKEKLSKVAAHCAYVQKEAWNEFHKYHYASAASVFEKVGEALTANRLVSIPTFRIHTIDARPTARQTTDTLVTVQCILEVHDLDSEVTLFTHAFGSGQDHGDKAVMKAQTAALKYAWMMLLNISTGDDPEADATVDSRASGEPIRAQKGPREYLETLERNKAAELSPLGKKAMELATQEEDLTPALEASIRRVQTWKVAQKPAEEETCKCGSPLVQRKTGKAKGMKPYLTCELSDRAFNKDRWAADRLAELDQTGECGIKQHTWKWVS